MIQNKDLIIVPDGKLNYLPFDALLTEMPDTAGTVYFNRLPYLIRKHTIHYSYSSSLLYGFSQERQRAEKRLLAFAPEYHSDTVVVENEKYILTPLPGVQQEVDLISDKIKSRLYRGKDATELHFRQECADYDILHLAMHAFINDSLPAFSRLAFTRNISSTPENDGWLNTADIYNFDLTARLAVLSACSTGQGTLKRGEGVMSLARGFLYSGCQTLVMTLWDVEDAAGTKIMHAFYQHLKRGKTPGEAIRQAKLNYLENANARLSHPHYWLGYVSIGKDSALFTSYDVYFFILLLLSLIGITIDQILRMKRKDK
jgi:CHAT domain-containing protein